MRLLAIILTLSLSACAEKSSVKCLGYNTCEDTGDWCWGYVELETRKPILPESCEEFFYYVGGNK